VQGCSWARYPEFGWGVLESAVVGAGLSMDDQSGSGIATGREGVDRMRRPKQTIRVLGAGARRTGLRPGWETLLDVYLDSCDDALRLRAVGRVMA
jgi:hypothetical protein